MSLTQTKMDFEELLDNRENGVVALTGAWGNGKTQMWNDVRKESTNDAIKGAIYVSLFGIKDILSLKLRMIQNVLPESKAGHIGKEIGAATTRQLLKFAKAFHPSFGVLDELAVLAVPAVLRNRLVVIDDIERKHASLNIDEIMGFIDEFRHVYGCRFLLILNTDQLSDKALWEKMREKVVDHEITLRTSPDEALQIALGGRTSMMDPMLREATEACGITNIRVVKKILRDAHLVLSIRPGLPADVLGRVIPSTVLLAAIHYKALRSGPTMDYVLGHNRPHAILEAAEAKRHEPAASVDARSDKRWKRLLQDLQISKSDEYEDAFADYLQTGLLDKLRIGEIFDRYVGQRDAQDIQKRFANFMNSLRWDALATDGSLLDGARLLAQGAPLLSAEDISVLHGEVSNLRDGASLADALIEEWLSHFRANPPSRVAPRKATDSHRYHPRIEEAFAERRLQLNPLPTLMQVCAIFEETRCHDELASEAMKSASIDDFEREIRSLSGGDLRIFIEVNLEFWKDATDNAQYFGEASAHFEAACANIYRQDEGSRLGKILMRSFDYVGLRHLLDNADPDPAQDLAQS